MTTLEETHHYEKGASQAKRFLACPGCIRMQRGIPAKPSRYAAEGTVAHHVAAECLESGAEAASFIGRTFTVDGFQIEVTAEMAEAVQAYLDYARKISADDMSIEKPLDLNWLSPGLGGTADLVIISGESLHVMDYKHGVWVFVGAEDNPQLMYYGLGAFVQDSGPMRRVKNIHLHICRPRFRNGPAFSEWVISADELIRWGACVLKPGAEACDDPAAPLRPGDHCLFCKVNPCPARLAFLEEVSRADFLEMTFPNPANMSPEDWRKVLQFTETVKGIISEINKAAYAAALAGNIPEGMKLVRKEKKRAWIDEEEAARSLEVLVGDAAFKRSLLSPNQTEGVLKAAGVEKTTISGLWHVPQGELALVADTDRRPAVNDFDNDFADIETEE